MFCTNWIRMDLDQDQASRSSVPSPTGRTDVKESYQRKFTSSGSGPACWAQRTRYAASGVRQGHLPLTAKRLPAPRQAEQIRYARREWTWTPTPPGPDERKGQAQILISSTGIRLIGHGHHSPPAQSVCAVAMDPMVLVLLHATVARPPVLTAVQFDTGAVCHGCLSAGSLVCSIDSHPVSGREAEAGSPAQECTFASSGIRGIREWEGTLVGRVTSCLAYCTLYFIYSPELPQGIIVFPVMVCDSFFFRNSGGAPTRSGGGDRRQGGLKLRQCPTAKARESTCCISHCSSLSSPALPQHQEATASDNQQWPCLSKRTEYACSLIFLLLLAKVPSFYSCVDNICL
jgi:hypothetical protein